MMADRTCNLVGNTVPRLEWFLDDSSKYIDNRQKSNLCKIKENITHLLILGPLFLYCTNLYYSGPHLHNSPNRYNTVKETRVHGD